MNKEEKEAMIKENIQLIYQKRKVIWKQERARMKSVV